MANLGDALKAVRTQMGMTLSETSQRTGLAISTLSKVEAGKMSLTYDKLLQLSVGLDIDIAELFAPAGTARPAPVISGRRSINRAGEGERVVTDHYDHLYLSMDVSGKRFVPLLVECRAHALDEFTDFVRHEGEEFIYVLEGAIAVHSEFYKPVVLEAGDSMWLDSQMGHAYVAHGEGRCRVVAMCSGTGDEELIEAIKRVDAGPARAPVARAKPPKAKRASSRAASPRR